MERRVERQVRLPLGKAVEIALRSLKARVGRSVLTLVTIGMAIAFLMNVWAMRIEPEMRTRAAEVRGGYAKGGAGEKGSAEAKAGVGRTVWLLSLSLLVCLVGISNAMLMSVMERFREIGTMKCLGAVDSFILKLFFLESLFLGAAGALGGVVIGAGLTVLLLVKSYGTAAWGQMPWGTLGGIAGGSVGIGLVITAAAALYPAWKAARMEPVAAMRVEV